MRQRGVQVIMLVLGITALVASDAVAQRRRGLVDVSRPDGRHGFWLEGGAGAGWESFKFDGEPYTESLTKPTFSLGLGGTVSPALRLGVEGTIWVYHYFDDVAVTDVTESLTALMAVGRFYPARHAGFFAKAGGGLGITATSLEFGDDVSETGFAWMLGAGYEIQLSRSLFLTPSIEWFQHSFQQREADTLHERLFNLGLRLTWQPGR